MITQQKLTPSGRKMSPAQLRSEGIRSDMLEYLRLHGAATVARLAEYCDISNGAASHCVVVLNLEGKIRRVEQAATRIGSYRVPARYELGDGVEVDSAEVARISQAPAVQTGTAFRDPLVAALFGPAGVSAGVARGMA